MKQEEKERIKTNTDIDVENDGTELSLLDPKMDYIFKQLFGVDGREDVLKDFLNSLLKGDPHIERIELKNTEISKILKDDKTCKLDVRGILNNNVALDIEIQCVDTGEIIARGISYLDELNVQSLQAGERYDTIKTIGIWILNESVTSRTNAINESCMTFLPNPPDGYEVLTKNKRLFFIELPKFNEEEADRKDLLNSWLAFLKNPETYDSSWIHNEAIKRAEEKLRYISLDPQTREIARLRERDMRERRDELLISRDKGREETRIQNARNMLRDGMPVDLVAKYSELSIEQVKALMI